MEVAKPEKIVLYTEVTPHCNNRCVFCPTHLVKRRGFIKDRVRERVINFVSAYPDIKFPIFFHFVGEPLLYPGLEDYIKSLSLPNAKLWISTNGILLDVERAKSLRKAGLKNIWYTFFYTNERDYKKNVRTNTFLKSKENLYNLLSKSELFDSIYIVTYSDDASEIEDMIRDKPNVSLEKSRKPCSWKLSGSFLAGYKPIYFLLPQFIKKYIATTACSYICITIDGDVTFKWIDYNCINSIGNICELDNDTIMQGYYASIKLAKDVVAPNRTVS